MRKFISLAVLTIIATACSKYATERNFDSICIGMSKQAAMENMQAQGVARGSILNKYGQVIEVREYKVDTGKTSDQLGQEIAFTICTLGLGAPIFCTHGEIDTYWLFFCEGILVQWGRAGDWAEAQKMIYDINFKISS